MMATGGNHEPTSMETDRAAHYHERRFRALVEHSMDIIALVNTEGLVTYVSPSITPIMGYSQEDFVGSSALILVHPGDLDHMQQVLGAIMQGGDQPIRAEYRLRCADGTYRWFEATATNWLEDPEVEAIVGHFHDITERKQAEEHKDAFLAMASHELKTPVTSLKGFTQVLSLLLADHPEAQVRLFLERMDAQLDKLTRLVNDLLTLSHMQAGDLSMREEAFDLDELIRETMEQVQATTITHRLQLQGATSVKVTGDRDRLAQVLVNLLTNAIRYSPQANCVLVRVQGDRRQAEIAVQDFGIGIDQAYHEQIFERFYQVPDQDERTLPGMGIGLYLARTITERHGGRISVESRMGKGSTFRVELPLVKGEQIDMPGHTLQEKREMEQ
jgi:PAS domain S-box-containing protein